MKKLPIILLSIGIFLSGCGSVPVTGRRQLSLVSNDQVLTTSFQQYGEFIKGAPLSKDAKNTELVRKVGQRIAASVEKYLTDNGMGSEVANYKWEFNLVQSKDVNAFCMPGGKIVVYEGILPYTQDETGLAVVLGHEVAHAVAKHANERMSQQMAAQYGAQAVGSALNTQSLMTQKIASAAMGLGTKGVLLKYSRSHELEADHLGLIFMSMAGYDPNKAAAFWTRMSQGGGGSTPEFMSTHPSDGTRVKKINEHLPEAMKYYTGNSAINAAPSATTNNKKGGKSNTPATSKGAKSTNNNKTSKDWTF